MKTYQKGSARLVIIIILALILISSGIYYIQNRKVDKVGEIEEKLDNTSTTEEVKEKTQTNTNVNTRIRIALLAGPAKDGDEKRLVGCDLVVLAERFVPYTQAPLNASLKELFTKKEPWPYSEVSLGNFISSQKDLFFDRATLDNGVAKVYLTGKLAPLNGVCDEPRLKTQINSTALQFSMVKSVQIYLNGNAI